MGSCRMFSSQYSRSYGWRPNSASHTLVSRKANAGGGEGEGDGGGEGEGGGGGDGASEGADAAQYVA